MPSFTEINTVFQAIIAFLKEFVEKVTEMFDGISYGFAGYPEDTTAAAEEEEINLPE